MYKFTKKILAIVLITVFAAVSASALMPSDRQRIEDFAEKIGVSEKDFTFYVSTSKKTVKEDSGDTNSKEKTHDKVTDKSVECALVPMYNVKEHVDCMKELFANSKNSDYMKYYLDGKIVSEDTVAAWVRYSVSRMSGDVPKSFTFIIACADECVGRLAVGPLLSATPEVGYVIKKEYSGKGIAKAAVKCLIGLLKRVKGLKNSKYKIERLRATAKPLNVASNKILSGLGFKKSAKFVNDGYGEENEYFYNF